jgi:parallel beta-helix repeat protein
MGKEKMRKIIALGIMLLILGISISSTGFILDQEYTTTLEGTTFYVDDNFDENTQGWNNTHFAKISDAINKTNDGDIVYVYVGTYNEDIVIENSINIIGENKYDTIISKNVSSIVSILANNVSFSGFTIKNSTLLGLHVGGNNCIISHNIIIGNNKTGMYVGSYLYPPSDNVIQDNLIINNGQDGIYALYVGEGNSIVNNIIENNTGNGIQLYGDSKNTFVGYNTIRNNKKSAIDMYDSNYITIKENYIDNNCMSYIYDGITLHQSDYNIFIDNVFTNSTGSIFMRFYKSNRNQISSNFFFNNGEGLWLGDNSQYNMINNNIMRKSGYLTIRVIERSDNNSIIKNSVQGNEKGIFINTDNNTVHNNIIEKNNMGLAVSHGYYNFITENNFIYNDYALSSFGGKNYIYHNNFLNNNISASASASNKTVWDDGKLGNYWDDYEGEDNNFDNIGDTPYNIDENYWYKDKYPLMIPYPGLYDTEPPYLNITKPEKALYIGNEKIRNRFFRMCLIIGDIDIIVDASDDFSGIEKVEFYIDGELMEIGWYHSPFVFNWKKNGFRLFRHIHTIKVIGYDNCGKTTSIKMRVLRFL